MAGTTTGKFPSLRRKLTTWIILDRRPKDLRIEVPPEVIMKRSQWKGDRAPSLSQAVDLLRMPRMTGRVTVTNAGATAIVIMATVQVMAAAQRTNHTTIKAAVPALLWAREPQ